MTLEFLLNGASVAIQAEENARLIEVLRGTCKLFGAKSGCLTGICGTCLVIFNGNVIKSCLIPAFRVQGSEIITIEGFSQTEACQDILRGFEQAGVETCGYCDTGKILMVESILARTDQPDREEILQGIQGIKCRCTQPELLVEAVYRAADIRQRRIYGRTG